MLRKKRLIAFLLTPRAFAHLQRVFIGGIHRLALRDPEAAELIIADAELIFQDAHLLIGEAAPAEDRADIRLILRPGADVTAEPRVPLLPRLFMVALAGAGTDQKPVAALGFVPEKQL